MNPALFGTDTPTRPESVAPVGTDIPQAGKVQSELNLRLPLKSPTLARPLAECLKAHDAQVKDALAELHYVHFARFLLSPEDATLTVITEFDGDFDPYILDFVVVLGDVFTAALQFIKGAPRLPVQRYPREFVEFVRRSNGQSGVWSAYPQQTVIDIQRVFQLPWA